MLVQSNSCGKRLLSCSSVYVAEQVEVLSVKLPRVAKSDVSES